ncbi:LysM peptidoglycan-binding domain-containing protein [Hydrocarboniphaga sp.]|uniref:LysM peptidoglycan-binding domain-containing protein n=1 Tax=Hydrocarboniphaga sp. TaxID=2033016 RepID=UPI002621062B|nr:LysM peptidoglycan-binding domain-containing protein [Hydrocarboniphaga sp.]
MDRQALSKFGVTGLAMLLAGLVAACASSTPMPGPLPAPAAEPAAEPMQTMAAAEPYSSAQPAPVLRPGAPLAYVVKRGDTLWDIANHFLLDPWQWPEIWYVNGQVRNPHLIYPGDVLQLSEVDGRPRLGLAGGSDLERVSPQVRELPLESAIPTIPIDAIRDFLRGPRLVTPEELKTAPYLLSFVDDHLIGGEGALIYVRRLPPQEPWSYALVRPGEPYKDPDDGSIIGYEAIPIGEVEVKLPGEPATALLSQSYREARVGDRLLPVEPEAFQADFYPHAPDHAIGGRIIAVFDGLSQISQFQIVAINRGSQHGLEPGHVLQIMQAGARVADPYGKKKIQLPDQPAGQLLVFKTTPRLSYGLVMSVTRPAHLLDKVEKPLPTRY